MSDHRRLIVACLATAALLVPLAWLWAASLLPDEYSVMDMGYADYGGGSVDPAEMSHLRNSSSRADEVDVSTLVADPETSADVKVDLVARKERFELKSGREVDGYTLNGESPGPVIRAEQGDLVQVSVRNESVPDGMTLHWHGVDVPNAMDGVAGVTQDAVLEGESFEYRYVADEVGTYWFHSHQVSHEQVRGGLFGTLIVAPKNVDPTVLDVPAVAHTYEGVRTINGREGDLPVEAAPGQRARVRVVNTDNGPMSVWVGGASYRVLAVDGTDLNKPTPVTDKSVVVTAGGRADLEVVMPADGSGVRVVMGGSTAVVLGTGSPEVSEPSQPDESLDLLGYGTPAPIGFDPADADRRFEFVIGRRPGFVDGRPGLWWTVNGNLYPNVPMFMVSEGDIVRMRIENKSGQVHPMHLHGHHAVVLSRNGVEATGSPWWTDSLNVADGESYDVAFVADNPGVWMDHCHNLPHAAEGLIAHVGYTGYTTPFRIGGKRDNEPE